MEDSEQYMKFKNNVLKKFLKDIKKKYKIIDNEGNEVLDEHLLQLNKFTRCQGVVTTSTGAFARCTKNATENCSYCKLHLKKELHKQMYQAQTENKNKKENREIIIIEPSPITEVSKGQLQKKFIEDSFYYIDSNFIYSIDDNRKVGIIDNHQYILTDDPFVLKMF